MKRVLFFLSLLTALVATTVVLKCVDKRPQLDVYNWPYYISTSALLAFEAQYHCKVNYKEFPSNEELLTAIENRTGAWDVVFPSDYMVEIMTRKHLLRTMDRSLVPNYPNIDARFLNREFDPENRYSLPYIWGATGIGFNKVQVSPSPIDYDVLWNAKYKNRIGLLDDVRFGLAAPLMWMGESPNTTDPVVLARAESLLVAQKPLVKAYSSENYVDLLKSGEVWLFYGYSGDIVQAIPDFPELDFIIPASGSAVYIDNMVIPVTCDQLTLAHAFVNYLLDPSVAAAIMDSTWFAMPNKAAVDLVRPEIRRSTAVFPPADVLEKCQGVRDLGMFSVQYEELWQRVKTAR